jgi:tetratricopeptide (TPR) repeat protein
VPAVDGQTPWRPRRLLYEASVLLAAALWLHVPAASAQQPPPDCDAYRQLVDRYREGEYGATVAALKEWPADASAAITKILLIDNEWREDVGRLKAAALLHSEVAFGRLPEALSRHRQDVALARSFVRRVEALEPQSEFARRWRLAVGYSLRARSRHVDALPLFQEASRKNGREDPEALVAMGQVYEFSVVREGLPVKNETERAIMRGTAAEHFRAALRIDPDCAEARLRLAHILLLRGDRAEARREIERLLETADHPYIRSLAWLFAGLIAESDADLPTAIRHYTSAVQAADPHAQSALIALAYTAHRAGEPKDAATLLQRAFSRPLPRADLWSAYFYQLTQLEDTMDWLRAEVRP